MVEIYGPKLFFRAIRIHACISEPLVAVGSTTDGDVIVDSNKI